MDRESLSTLVAFIAVLFHVYFGIRGVKNQGGTTTEEDLTGQKVEYFLMGFTEPWRTPFSWGGVLQVILILALIFL